MDALLLHGFTHTGASWARLRATLPRGYTAVSPDLRGHGSASGTRPVDLESVLADLVAELRTAPAAGVTMVGYSQGGRIALHAALDPRIAPRLRRLVLIGAAPGLADPQERAARRAADERLADEFEALTIDALAARWAGTPILSGLPAEIGPEVRADRLRSSPAGLAAALRGLGTAALPSLWDRLGKIAVPTVLLAGARDEKFTQIARRVARQMALTEVRIVPGAGHAVHLEAPAEVAAAMTDPLLR